MSHCLIVIYAVEVIIFPGGRFDVRRETTLLAEMNLTIGNNLSGCWLQTVLPANLDNFVFFSSSEAEVYTFALACTRN